MAASIGTTGLDFFLLALRRRLKTTNFWKPISKNTLLRIDGNSSRHVIKNFQIDSFVRLHRNYSEDEDFQSKAPELAGRFKARGYHITHIDSAYQKALSADRHCLLDKNLKCQTCSRVCADKQTILKHRHVLQSDLSLRDVFLQPPTNFIQTSV